MAILIQYFFLAAFEPSNKIVRVLLVGVKFKMFLVIFPRSKPIDYKVLNGVKISVKSSGASNHASTISLTAPVMVKRLFLTPLRI